MEMENIQDKGFIWSPYITKTVSTQINNETVWYSNKWKNFFLKLKHLIIKPKYLKNANLYSNKIVNSSLYGVIDPTNSNSFSFDVNEKLPFIINLTRDDLRFDFKYQSFEHITRYSFKPSVLSREDIGRADKIIFTDDNNETIILKER